MIRLIHSFPRAIGPLVMLMICGSQTDLPAATVIVEGTNVTIARFGEDERAYGNRSYVWKDVPKKLVGWQFTRLDGGVETPLRVRCEEMTDIHIATTASQKGIDLSGWTRVDGLGFYYTDKGRSKMAVFKKPCKPGERLVIPQGNWTGGILLAPQIKAVHVKPEPDLGQVPGVVIDHSPKASGVYIGSPSLAVLPDGRHVASHDEFGPKSTEHTRAVTRIFSSADRGASWKPISTINGQFWSTLFVHRRALYIIGAWCHHGNLIIRRSRDGGRSWSTPRDEHTGLLATGKFHCAPQPVMIHAGRLWRAMENAEGPGGWGARYRAFMMSVPLDADLLERSSWTFSNYLGRDPKWLSGEFTGWLEGNAVVDPGGRVVNILRVERGLRPGTAAMIRISDDGKTATFDPTTGFIDLPGAAKKFTIRHDPVSRRYWSLATWVMPKFVGTRKAGGIRNTLALISSADLRQWMIERVVLHHPDVQRHGFQYPDWHFDGDDLIAVVRTAYDDGLGGAHNNHDANFLTFHRIENFRKVPAGESRRPFRPASK